MSNRELEVKFYLADLPAFERRLQQLGAVPDHARAHEINLRFDLPDGSLSRARRVLRLRQDSHAYFTYKGPAELSDGVSARQEVELDVPDFEQAKAFLEALGYVVMVMYEKYRTGYRFRDVLITLDEMPFGTLCELEGPDGATIRAAADALGLDWEARSLASYLQLFDFYRTTRGLTLRHLSFAEFEGLFVTPAELGLRPADIPNIP